MVARLDAHSVPADSNDQTASEKATQALELLRKEARIHQQETTQTGLIGRAAAGVTEFFHHGSRTGAEVDAMSKQLQADLAAGKTGDAAALAKNARGLVDRDQAALKLQGEISQISSGTIQAAALFMGGKKGLVAAGTVAVLDSIKPGSKDSFNVQLGDAGLAVSRAMALKGGFALAGKLNLGMATTAIGLGVETRLTDLTFNRQTYLDEHTGKFNADLGAQRIWDGVTDKRALATDVLGLVVARGALGKINAATDGALTSNKLWSNIAVGGVFGTSQGVASEAVRQEREGVLNLSDMAKKGFTGGLTGMAGAAFGSAGMSRAEVSARAESEISKVESTKPGARIFNISDAKQNFGGSISREYQLVGEMPDVAGLMASGKNAALLARVREVQTGGKLGPEQNLLVQHGGDGIPVNTKLAAQADVVATCNPWNLPPELRSRHILPSTQESLWLSQKPGGRINFTTKLSEFLKPGEPQPVALGNRSVSEMLQDPAVLDKIYFKPNPHDLGLYSQVLKGFKIPGKQVLVGGADSLVVELADSSILKITHQQWNPDWGHRTYRDAAGNEHVFDARIIGKPQTFDRPDGMATYYIQERAITPVRESSVNIFAHRLDADGVYSFWDRDATQLGLVMRGDKRVIRLLDYDAVRPPHLVPRDMKVPHEDRFDSDDRYPWI